MSNRTPSRAPVPWHGGPRNRDLTLTVEEIDYLGPNRLPNVIGPDHDGTLRSVACWGTSRPQAEKLKPGDRVKFHESAQGFRTITVEVPA